MNVLVLNTSLRAGDASVSRRMVARYLARLRSVRPDAVVRERDLAASPIPHLPAELAVAQMGGDAPATPSATIADALIAELIDELERTDVLVLGIAMYNFSISSALKAWFDHVTRARRTFAYVDGRPQGLLPAGKRAVAFVASGGFYTEGPALAADLLEPHLRTLLAFIGIDDLTVVRAEGQAFPDAPARVDRALERAAAAVCSGARA